MLLVAKMDFKAMTRRRQRWKSRASYTIKNLGEINQSMGAFECVSLKIKIWRAFSLVIVVLDFSFWTKMLIILNAYEAPSWLIYYHLKEVVYAINHFRDTNRPIAVRMLSINSLNFFKCIRQLSSICIQTCLES